MHTHQSSPIRVAGRAPAIAVTVVLLVLASLVWVSRADAADGSQYSKGAYGEIPTHRFGSFDSTWYDNGLFDGSGGESAPTPGKFLFPVGFAVDASDTSVPDDTAIYVLDRVSDVSEATAESGTRWRLQKLTDTGAPVALTEFFLPKSGAEVCSSRLSTVEPVGLAVSGGSVYTVIAGNVGEECNTATYAEEIVAWSTTPASGQLVRGGGTEDTLSSPVTAGSTHYSVPRVVSTAEDLESPTLYEVRGLTAVGSNTLALLGDTNDRFTSPSGAAAPALAIEVSTTTGGETASWSSASNGLAVEAGDSISTNVNSGKVDLLLNEAGGNKSTGWTLVELSPSLASPTVLEAPDKEPANAYQAPVNALFRSGEAPAGPHGVWLANGLFAASTTASPSPYWQPQDGIRLTAPLGDGTLSSSSGPSTVYDTLGKAASGACDLTAGGTASSLADLVLAAGQNGSVWALNVGKDNGTTHVGRVVTELAPSAGNPCAAPPSGTTFSLTDESAAPSTPHLASAGPLTVSVGARVQFSTAPFEYPILSGGATFPAAVFAFEWDPIGGAPGDAGYTLLNQNPPGAGNVWPPGTTSQFATTEEHLYTTPGTYTVKLKAIGELGEYDTSGTVIVQAAAPPTAAFTLPGSIQAGQVVSLDASGSQATGSAHIANYHWEFGDGGEDDTQSPAETHVFAAPGLYTVTLSVRDSGNQVGTVTHQITITAPSTVGGGGGGTTGGGSSGGSTGGGSTPGGSSPSGGGAPSTGGSKPKPKQSPAAATKKKLAAALKQCKKKPASKRKACEKQARAKFSGKSKKK
jgi:PKD repeat protein